MVKVCFVCMGNICRSPTAEGILLKLIKQSNLHKDIEVDSAGTLATHTGEPADRRSAATALAHGVTLDCRARQFVAVDFSYFDYIIALDHANLRDLERLACDDEDKAKLFLLRSFDPTAPPNAAVPDPYYPGQGGANNGFEEVYGMCERGCIGLLQYINITD